ncbi:unnamed protein product [Lepidochelys kempii]
MLGAVVLSGTTTPGSPCSERRRSRSRGGGTTTPGSPCSERRRSRSRGGGTTTPGSPCSERRRSRSRGGGTTTPGSPCSERRRSRSRGGGTTTPGSPCSERRRSRSRGGGTTTPGSPCSERRRSRSRGAGTTTPGSPSASHGARPLPLLPPTGTGRFEVSALPGEIELIRRYRARAPGSPWPHLPDPGRLRWDMDPDPCASPFPLRIFLPAPRDTELWKISTSFAPLFWHMLATFPTHKRLLEYDVIPSLIKSEAVQTPVLLEGTEKSLKETPLRSSPSPPNSTGGTIDSDSWDPRFNDLPSAVSLPVKSRKSFSQLKRAKPYVSLFQRAKPSSFLPERKQTDKIRKKKN